MKKKTAAPICAALIFDRADPAALAAFDQKTKVCTMNCGPSTHDPRSDKERKFLCTDCLGSHEI